MEVNKMPNKDGTGPEGKGPLTGRGLGNCKGTRTCPRGSRSRSGQGKGRGRRQA